MVCKSSPGYRNYAITGTWLQCSSFTQSNLPLLNVTSSLLPLASRRNFKTESTDKPLSAKLFTSVQGTSLATVSQIGHKRLLSSRNENISHDFSASIHQAKKKFVPFLKLSNINKASEITSFFLEEKMGMKRTPGDIQSKWETLQNVIKENFNGHFNLPSYNSENPYENAKSLHEISSPPCLQNREELIRTTTDTYWMYQLASIPFARRNENIETINALSKYRYIFDQLPSSLQKLSPLKSERSTDQELMDILLSGEEEDAVAIYPLLLPELEATTAIHEIGCWNGQNLINMAFYANLKGRALSGCLGTDINITALNLGTSVRDLLGLPEDRFKLCLANAHIPIDMKKLGIPYKKQIKLLLRVIPVLDEVSIRKLLKQLQENLTFEDAIVLSYALPEGETYERNIAKAKEGAYFQKEFKEGTTFSVSAYPYLPSSEFKNSFIIANTYLSEEGFRLLVNQYGFNILYHLKVGKNSDNMRGVCLLKKGKN